jgi:hypothetical protein
MKIKQNKLTPQQKKLAEGVKERLKDSMGKDEAEKQAIKGVVRRKDHPSGRGGGRNAGGESQKPSHSGRRRRTGSKSNASK